MMRARDASPRYVLGVNSGPHDGSAALLRDGELVAMVEQERLSRRKRAMRESPCDAIAACLAHEDIDLSAVGEIAVGWDVPALVDAERAGVFDEREFAAWLLGDVAVPAGVTPPICYVQHHLAHAASAFYTSGLAEAAILVVDGRGESVSTTVAAGGPSGIEVIETWGTHLSLGHLFGTAAEWAGLTLWGAGKLMGLASYGRGCQPVPLSGDAHGYTIASAPSPDLPASEQLQQLGQRLREGFRAHNYPFERGQPADVMAHADFAASIQGALEETMLGLAAMARRESGHPKLALAGGVALNCTANGSLIRAGVFDEVWIPPFPHDAGVSLGAALFVDRSTAPSAKTQPRLPHAFWAPTTAGPDVEALSRLSECDVTRLGDAQLADAVAQHLVDGKLVGWWQGRAEVGQRALGARSILCDPRRRRSLVRANRVKGRETWRPLAPAVLADHAGSLFEGALPAATDFMLAAWPVRKGAQIQIPAAVHVDGSARPQLVGPEQSRYYRVIEAFRERTGTPAVANTSFNLAGEPIVLTSDDAVSTFLRSDLDVLVLGDLVAVKPPAERPLRASIPRQIELNDFWALPWINPGRAAS